MWKIGRRCSRIYKAAGKVTDPKYRGEVPTRHLLGAAHRVATAVSEGHHRLSDTRQVYTRTPTEGRFSQGDLVRGEKLLEECGLVKRADDQIHVDEKVPQLGLLPEDEACEIIMFLRLTVQSPAWMGIVTGGSMIAEEYIPDRDRHSLREVIPEADRRKTILAAAGSKEGGADRSELGEKGEQHVVRKCRHQRKSAGYPKLARAVQQVSKWSDHFGYDILAPTIEGSYRLEVKTTRRLGSHATIHLTRNQARVGQHDPRWSLVLCHAQQEDRIRLVGYSSGSELLPVLPEDIEDDRGFHSKWAGVRLTLPVSSLRSGLPPL